MADIQNDVLGVITTLGIASELDICKNSDYLYRDIHNALKVLYRSGIIDTNDDGSYFAVSFEVDEDGLEVENIGEYGEDDIPGSE